MKKYNLKKFSYGSYIKFMSISSFGMGLIFGFLFLVMAICGGNVTFNGQVVDYGTGILVGLGVLVLFPVMWCITLTIFAAICPGALLILKIFGGMKIKAIIADENIFVEDKEKMVVKVVKEDE